MTSPENASWILDCEFLSDISVPGGDLPSLNPPSYSWQSHSVSATPSFSVEHEDALNTADDLKEAGSRKRQRPFCGPVSKAHREKIRRDKLNDRFSELGSLLDPARPPKIDKSVILVDAARKVTQMRGEFQKLKELNESLQEKINELKAEKDELREEKQRLKADKEKIEQQLKLFNTQPNFLPRLPTHSSAFSALGQVPAGKLVSFIGYPGASMWQFMPPAAVDTSQDHTLHPPVA